VELQQISATHVVDAPIRRLLFLSRIHPVKGLVPLIEAWDQIRPAGWEVIVAGPDEEGHRSELERLLIRKRLQASFRFVGAADDAHKAQLFASADLFVLPSFSENFGLVVAEALSYGVPVLTTRGAPWEVLNRIGAGWWVDSGVAGVAQGLRIALATTAAERRRMGLAGQAYIREQLGWQDAARKTIQAYRWCLGLDSGIPDHLQLD
jgi:glycosyltransferase involved in cell wall biosynthesis